MERRNANNLSDRKNFCRTFTKKRKNDTDDHFEKERQTRNTNRIKYNANSVQQL